MAKCTIQIYLDFAKTKQETLKKHMSKVNKVLLDSVVLKRVPGSWAGLIWSQEQVNQVMQAY